MMGGVSLRKPRSWISESRHARLRLVAFVLDPHGPSDARELVGQGAGRLVVVGTALELERPGSQPIDIAAGAPGDGGGAKHRACAVGEERSHVTVTALGDTP